MTTDTIEAFKRAFRRHAAGVAIVTTLDGQRPVGFTATSLASLSADPPLVTFNMARTASSWRAVESGERVLVHMLGARNRRVAELMSGERELRFSGGHWRAGPYGLPVITDATAWLVCRIVNRVAVDGAAVVIARVERGGLGRPDAPLVYHERAYHTPQPL